MASTKKENNQPNLPQAPYSLFFFYLRKEILWLVVALFSEAWLLTSCRRAYLLCIVNGRGDRVASREKDETSQKKREIPNEKEFVVFTVVDGGDGGRHCHLHRACCGCQGRAGQKGRLGRRHRCHLHWRPSWGNPLPADFQLFCCLSWKLTSWCLDVRRL